MSRPNSEQTRTNTIAALFFSYLCLPILDTPEGLLKAPYMGSWSKSLRKGKILVHEALERKENVEENSKGMKLCEIDCMCLVELENLSKLKSIVN